MVNDNMNRIQVNRTINAPVETVFNTVADIREFSKALPHVVKYEFLSDLQAGVGTRFRETRLMNGKEAATELEVTEHVDNDRVRMVADSHGAIWDTTFIVAPQGTQSKLTMTMDAKAYKLMTRMMNFLIKGMIRKAVERDMDLVKSYCENGQP